MKIPPCLSATRDTRYGSLEELKARRGKLYCEKLTVLGVGQVTPMHLRWNKVEDIISRGGGKLVIQLYSATTDEGLADSKVTVSINATKPVVKAGGDVQLILGESITLPPRLYHKFWGAQDRVLVGEVSLVSDDKTDDRFHEPIDCSPEIEEDEPPLHLLVTD